MRHDGESPTLTDDERRRVVEIVVESRGQVPVLASAGGVRHAQVVERQARWNAPGPGLPP